MNADGSGQRKLTANTVNDGFPSWTADGEIVFVRRFVAHCCDSGDLWLIDPATGVETRLTDDPAADHLPDASRAGSAWPSEATGLGRTASGR